MNGFALLALALLLLFLTAVISTFALARNRILRHHRVDPKLPTAAPLMWSLDPRTPARLHRRLARVGTATSRMIGEAGRIRGARRRAPEPTPLQSAASELREQAVALDVKLTGLAVLDARARRVPLVELARAVDRLENATARLIHLDQQLGGPGELTGTPGALGQATERVDLLARAHEELLRLDRDAGLGGDAELRNESGPRGESGPREGSGLRSDEPRQA